MTFQKTVTIVAGIVFVLTLYMIYHAMKTNATSESWPPVIGQCPDYWVDEKGDGAECINTHRLGTCNIPEPGDKNGKNFNVTPYNSSDTGDCSKRKWATACGVTWDGITYGVTDPCNDI